MADLSNFGNGLMGAFLFLMIGTGALLTLTAENWDWYQPIINTLTKSTTILS